MGSTPSIMSGHGPAASIVGPQPTVDAPHQPKGRRWVPSWIPNGLVLTGIAGFAWIGHRTEWTFGVFRDHAESSQAYPLITSTTMIPITCEYVQFQEPCPHGVFDCPQCSPIVAQLPSPPAVTDEELERMRRALSLRPRNVVDRRVADLPRVVRFPSAEAVEQAGIDVTPVWRDSVTEAIEANGELTFDPAQVANLSARVAGTAYRVYKRVGEQVQEGDVLAYIESSTISAMKAAFQQALVDVKLKTIAYQNIQNAPIAERNKREAAADLHAAESSLLSAEQALINLGFDPRSRDLLMLSSAAIARQLQVLGLPSANEIEPRETLSNGLLPVRAPFEGIVFTADVVAGEVVADDRVLFSIVNARRMRLTLAVPVAEVEFVKLGQEVKFRSDGSNNSVVGQVEWVGSAADQFTRTIPVRITLTNPDGRLKAYALGQGEIILRVDQDAIVVPLGAIQKVHNTPVVFVRDQRFFDPQSNKAFHLRAVRLGAQKGDSVEIVAGLFAGEIVVTDGSDFLLNEVTREQSARVALARRAKSRMAQSTSSKNLEMERQ